MDDPVWDPSTVSKHRERWLAGDVARAFFDQVLGQARERERLSAAHCTVDGTRLAAWAGQKCCRRKEAEPPSPPADLGTPRIDCHGERRTNAPHASTTDPEARLYKQASGQAAKRADLGHVLMEHRHGLVVDTRVTQATGTAAREAALAMAQAIPGPPRVTVGADKHDDPRDCVRELRQLRVPPHVAQNPSGRSSALDGRTPRHPGYTVSQRKRTCVEESFGWLKTVGRTRAATASSHGNAWIACHRRSSLFSSRLGIQSLVRPPQGAHLTPGIRAGAAVQLLCRVFQQPARRSMAARMGGALTSGGLKPTSQPTSVTNVHVHVRHW